MRNLSIALGLALVACATTPDESTTTTAAVEQAVTPAFHREHIAGDLYHYEATIPIGRTPNAAIRVHRIVREIAPFVPRRSAHAAMLLHGDFSTFVTNFAPGLGDPASPVRGVAPYLAQHDIDVWGVDRRWTLPTTTGDTSDFGAMGVVQELDDLRAALALARTVRGDAQPLALVGFSHGAQLAYTYASVEATRPARDRHVGALVALDFYGDLGPDAEAAGVRQLTCDGAAFEYQAVADGTTDSSNDFLITVGQLARSAPDDASPFFDGSSNRTALLITLGQTYLFAPYAPLYHLLAPILDGDAPTGLRETAVPAASAWLAGAPPHESMREAADLDALLCGSGPQPIVAPLSRIRVPLLYVGAAGGVGTLGVHATTSVGSTDVTATVVHRFGADRAAEDVGHGDLLFGTDAPALVWQPLAAWIVRH